MWESERKWMREGGKGRRKCEFRELYKQFSFFVWSLKRQCEERLIKTEYKFDQYSNISLSTFCLVVSVRQDCTQRNSRKWFRNIRAARVKTYSAN